MNKVAIFISHLRHACDEAQEAALFRQDEHHAELIKKYNLHVQINSYIESNQNQNKVIRAHQICI